MYSIGSTVFENWKIAGELGSGSFGTVYELHREDFGEAYRSAMKVITVPHDKSEIHLLAREGMTSSEIRRYLYESVTELVHEFAIMAKLKATGHIVSYEDHKVIQHEQDIGWDIQIRMELLTPLLDYAYLNPFTRRDIIQLGIDICKALELCQKYNIIHRDIKPDNIYVTENGDFKLGDFGIARSIDKTSSGLSKKGTYNYMAPEVYTGSEYGFSVDTYSLGIVLYRLLNQNRIPFLPQPPHPITVHDRENALAMRMAGEKMPAPFYGDGRLGEIVLKACAHDPLQRYSSPMQMRQELEAILYDTTDANLIYPSGDEIRLQKNVYASQAPGKPAHREDPTGDATVLQGRNKPDPLSESVTVSREKPSEEATTISPRQPVAEATPKKKKKNSLLPVLLLLAVLLAGGTFLGFQLLNRSQEKLRNYESCMAQALEYRSSDPDTALALYRNAQELYPDEEAPYVAYALTLYDAHQYEDCVSYIENDLSLGKRFSEDCQSQLSEILGAAYFELEDYAAAASFFRLSAMGDSITVSAMRDYAVCLGKLGDLPAADAIMEQMRQAGASGAVMSYVQAEIDYDTGNYLLAEEGFSVALKTAGDAALQRRALRSLAELYRTCGAMEQNGTSPVQDPMKKEIQVLSDGIRDLHLETDSTLVEMLAMAYYEQSLTLEDDATVQDYLTKSAKHFRMVVDMGIQKDYLFRNLYSIHYALGNFQEAGNTLAEYERVYPNDYMPHALRAILLIAVENEKPQSQRDYSAVEAEYEIAGNLLRSTDDPAYYQQIQGLIEQLKKNNWL